jgi:protein-disulfide isomerase
VEPKLAKSYIENGILRLEWHDFPYLGQESVNAARAARAAQEQGKFWPYHDLLYENQNGENNGAFTQAKLLSFARKLDLNVGEFRKDMNSVRVKNAVSSSFAQAQKQGIAGTPTFKVNGRTISGYQSFDTFSKLIEGAKKQSDGSANGG